MPALGAARRLVGEDARALELVGGNLVGHRLQRACVEGRGHAVGAVGPAVQPGAEVHPGDRAVLRETRLDPHQHRVPAPMDVEDLFTRQGDLHGAARQLGQPAGRDLVGEGIELAAETATHRRGDDADMRRGQIEDLGQEPVHVVRRLGGGPERQLAVGAPVRDRRVLLHGQMGVALEEEGVLAHEVGPREGRLDVPELERDGLVDIGTVPVLVDPRFGMGESLLDGKGILAVIVCRYLSRQVGAWRCFLSRVVVAHAVDNSAAG